MQFRLLGPVEVVVNDRPVTIAAARQQIALALLLLEAGHVVSVTRIIDALWGEEPPRTARSQVQITISRLRRLLGESVIATRLPGYLIEASPESIDLVEFERLTASGTTAAAAQRIDQARNDLRAALALWRGPAMEGVQSEVIQSAARRLNERRTSAYLDCLELELRLGKHQEIIGELTALVAEHPLNERFRGQLMLALYRGGRQADALETYRAGREVLQEDLGLDPSAELHRLEQAILTRDPQIDLPGPRAPVDLSGKPVPTPPVPPQVPRTIGDPTRRTEVPGEETSRDPLEVPVLVLTGRDDAGKTAVALRAAHLFSPEVSDGPLFLRLFPEPPDGAALLLEQLARSLGMHSGLMPPDLESRMALYRSVLAGLRMLVVIDGRQQAR